MSVFPCVSDVYSKPLEFPGKKKKQVNNSQMLHVWNIYLPTCGLNVWLNVGKYSSPMEHMGFVNGKKTRVKRNACRGINDLLRVSVSSRDFPTNKDPRKQPFAEPTKTV